MITKPQTFVFYGRSGGGKGTQAKLLIEKLSSLDPNRKVLYIETGSLLRSMAAKPGFGNGLVKRTLETGGLLPEFVPVHAWGGFLIENITGKDNEHLVFDGVCRRVPEGPVFMGSMKYFERPSPKILVINVSKEWATSKLLKRGRNDDSLEHINNRQQWYEENVLPTIDLFRKDPFYTVLDINGEQTIEQVHNEILQKSGLSG